MSQHLVDLATLDPIPANYLVRPRLPREEALLHTSLFVTHCGMNSTMESIHYGVPTIGIPQMLEQMMTAQHIKKLVLETALNMKSIFLVLISFTTLF